MSEPVAGSRQRRQAAERPRRAAGSFWRDLLQPGNLAVLLALVFALLGPILTIDLSGGPASQTGAGNTLRQVTYLLTFAVALWAAKFPSDLRRVLVLPWTMMAVLIWFWLSLSWAIEPGIAVRRLFLTTLIVWMVFLAVNAAGYARTIAMMRLVLVISLLTNYAAIAVLPSAVHRVIELGDPGLIGDWRGILPQKNFTGAICALTILVFVFDPSKLWLSFRLGMLAAAGFYLWKTGSKTSITLLAPSCALGAFYLVYDKRYRTLILPILAVLGGIAVLASYGHWGAWLNVLVRPDAVTGRGQIWLLLLDYIRDHWLQGSGYGSFWNIGPDSPVFRYGRGWVTTITSGHNGYLDLLAQVGAPGMVLVLVAAVLAPLAVLFSNEKIRGAEGALPVAILIFCLGHNATESSLFERDAIVQVFMLFAIALARWLAAHPIEAAPSAPAAHWARAR